MKNDEEKQIREFVPTVLAPDIAVMLVRCQSCTQCRRTMIEKSDRARSAFPLYMHASVDAQIKRAGWVDASYATNENGGQLCVECAVAHAAFKCYACNLVRRGEPKETFGWGSLMTVHYLCLHCFETVPAKRWEELQDELRQEHQYDHI